MFTYCITGSSWFIVWVVCLLATPLLTTNACIWIFKSHLALGASRFPAASQQMHLSSSCQIGCHFWNNWESLIRVCGFLTLYFQETAEREDHRRWGVWEEQDFYHYFGRAHSAGSGTETRWETSACLSGQIQPGHLFSFASPLFTQSHVWGEKCFSF